MSRIDRLLPRLQLGFHGFQEASNNLPTYSGVVTSTLQRTNDEVNRDNKMVWDKVTCMPPAFQSALCI
ncbi:Choline oxidase [Fusarium oxysporum f. sp. albedinis]|nr:Choline oxidase [Fusarium oxysporum f. sp. albedinis]